MNTEFGGDSPCGGVLWNQKLAVFLLDSPAFWLPCSLLPLQDRDDYALILQERVVAVESSGDDYVID